MKSISIVIFLFFNIASLTSQQIAVEFGNRAWYSEFKGTFQGLSLTYDVGKRWEFGPNLTTSNHIRLDEYFSNLAIVPDDPNPTQSAYRIRNGRTMVDSPEFYRGLGTTSRLQNSRFFETNGYQYLGLGITILYKIVNRDNWQWYARVIPSYQRERREYVLTILPLAQYKLNEDEEYSRVHYTEKLVNFNNLFGLQFGTGLTYRVYGKLSIGLDISYYGVSFAPAFMVRYKIK